MTPAGSTRKQETSGRTDGPRHDPAAVLQEVDMAVTVDDGLEIAGTLALPAGREGQRPAVALLWAGKLDREGNTRKATLDLGRPMAAALAARGVASYRFDRRGVGETGGDWRRAGFFRHRADALAVLRALAARPEVRGRPVGVIGYSEGGLHAAWLGAHAVPPCAAVVLLACPAQRGDDFYMQWAARLGKEQVPWWLRLALRPLGRTPQDQVARVIARIKATTEDVQRVYGFKVPARQLREYLGYNPKPDLQRISVPVLAITGDNDFSIDPRDLDVIARLVPGPVQTRRIERLTHLLRRDRRPASAKTYREQYKLPVDHGLLDEVAEWVGANLRGRGAPARK